MYVTDLKKQDNNLTNQLTPTREHVRFLEVDSSPCYARSWLPNWSAGGLSQPNPALRIKLGAIGVIFEKWKA